MKIQIQTDNHVQNDPSVTQHVERSLDAQVGHLASEITRIEVHLSDVNGQRRGEDDRVCRIEARLAGSAPLAVSDAAATTAGAVTGAARKLRHAIDHARGKQSQRVDVDVALD